MTQSEQALDGWLVVTDLDGTLLDHTYPLAAAARSLDTIAALDCVAAVVVASSKTLPEMLELAALCTQPPLLIFENGAGLAWQPRALPPTAELPAGRVVGDYRVSLAGPGYACIRQQLLQLRLDQRFDFVGFGDLTPAEVGELTGLTPEAAAAAQQREASEPLLWRSSPADLGAFSAALQTNGLQVVRGGRFLHVSAPADKARAVRQLAAQLARTSLQTLACGDAPNDLQMLNQAERAIVFPDPDGGYLQLQAATVSHAPAAGPEPWLAAVQAALSPCSPQEAQAS